MNLTKWLHFFTIWFIAVTLLPSLATAQTRTWTDSQGRSFEGLLLNYDEEFVRIERTSDKRQFKLPRTSLSDSDNAYLDQLLRQQRVEKFLKDIPKTYDEAHELSIDKDTPVYIFYRNSSALTEFDALVEKLVTDSDFQAFIKDKAKIAVVRDKDVYFEAIAPGYVNHTDRACMLIIKASRTYAIRGFVDTTPENFRTLTKEMYQAYDESIY